MRGAGLDWLEALGPQRIRPGLSRTRALLASLGSPERSFRSVLIGGTNGKGSTAAALSAILHAGGLPVGLYTSPHLLRVNERVRIDERDVEDGPLDDILALLSSVSAPDDLAPTYFEALTVCAFELFRRGRVEVAVVEVGLGGRLDATNVVEPEVSIVTNVGHDHLEILGPTIADVAREKAGIFRAGQPALTAASGEALAVLHEEARRVGARLLEVPPTDRFEGISPLVGAHQRSNLALAAAAAAALRPLDDATIRRGVVATRWPGRLELVRRPGRRDVLLDGAHNPEGIDALAAHLVASGLCARVDLVFGALADKDLGAMFHALRPHVGRVVAVAPRSPRALPANELASRLGVPETAANVGEALGRLDDPRATGPILVTGSLVLIAEALEVLGGRGTLDRS